MALRSIEPETSAVGNDGLRTFNTLYQQLDLLKKSENYAYKILSNRAEAEDIALNAYLRVARKVTHNQSYIRDSDSISNYIFRTVHNLCIDVFRSKERVGLNYVKARTIVDTTRNFDAFDAKSIYFEALRSLPDVYYHPILLQDVEKLTAAEGASRLNISVPAFKSRLYRGREMLRAKLIQMGVDKELMFRQSPG